MSDLLWLSEAQMRRIEPYFPLSHGVPRVDDRRIISGIIFVIRNGLRWRDAPADYGPPKTIYNRFIRWSRLGVFNKIFAALAAKGGKPDQLMIDAPHLKAHRTAASLLKKGDVPRRIGRTKGGLNSKLHTVCDGKGRPLVMLLSEAMTPTGSAKRLRSATSPPVFPQRRTGRCQSRTTPRSIVSATRSKTCSASSRTGGASTPDTTVAPTPSCPPSVSPPPSSSGSINES